MARLRLRAAFSVLALMLLGIAAGAGSALASGACCAMATDDAPGRGAPCHSVAPTSCCEDSAAARAPSLPGAPVFAAPCGPTSLAAAPLAAAPAAPPPWAPVRSALASVVLRL